jgi:hypothetical protein
LIYRVWICTAFLPLSYHQKAHHRIVTPASFFLLASSSSSFPIQAASNSQQEEEESVVEGLVADFDRLDAVHETIQELQRQLPSLLATPLSEAQARKSYTDSTRLFVADSDSGSEFELASSLQELVSISNTFALATAASVRAGNFLSSSLGRGSSNSNATTGSSTQTTPRVKCRIILVDPTVQAIRVEWETQLLPLLDSLPTGTTAKQAARIQGTSLLLLDPDSGRVASHQLSNVNWNGQDQQAQVIGQSLSTLRQTFRSLQQSPFLQPFFSGSSPLGQVGQELLQQLSAASMKVSSSSTSPQERAPVYVLQSLDDLNATDQLIAIDEWLPAVPTDNQTDTTPTTSQPPVLPGSSGWPRYAATHRAVLQFLETALPALSGESETGSAITLKSFFSPRARLLTLDGSLLLQDASRIANLFQSLAVWRRRSFASWTLQRAVVLDERGPTRIRVDYTISVNIPGATSTAMSVHGSDTYTLAEPSVSIATIPTTVQIEQVIQTKLWIGENRNLQDGVFFMRSVATAVETGRFRNNEDSLVLDFLQRRMTNIPTNNRSKLVSPKRETTAVPRRLDDAAAAKVYRIMSSLNEDLALLLDEDINVAPPCLEYMVENVQLQGYLGTTLLRGQTAYKQNLGLLLASLRAALRTGRLLAEQPQPLVRVELTTAGNVRLSTTLFLKVVPLVTGFPGLDPSMFPLGSGSLPLKIGLVSEYIIDPATGLITQHLLVESRINGELTPADIVSKWIQRRQVGGDSDATNGEESWVQTILDTFNWVRLKS